MVGRTRVLMLQEEALAASPDPSEEARAAEMPAGLRKLAGMVREVPKASAKVGPGGHGEVPLWRLARKVSGMASLGLGVGDHWPPGPLLLQRHLPFQPPFREASLRLQRGRVLPGHPGPSSSSGFAQIFADQDPLLPALSCPAHLPRNKLGPMLGAQKPSQAQVNIQVSSACGRHGADAVTKVGVLGRGEDDQDPGWHLPLESEPRTLCVDYVLSCIFLCSVMIRWGLGPYLL